MQRATGQGVPGAHEDRHECKLRYRLIYLIRNHLTGNDCEKGRGKGGAPRLYTESAILLNPDPVF